jgi:DNA-binding protein YbaB
MERNEIERFMKWCVNEIYQDTPYREWSIKYAAEEAIDAWRRRHPGEEIGEDVIRAAFNAALRKDKEIRIERFMMAYMNNLRDSSPDCEWVVEYAAEAAIEAWRQRHPDVDVPDDVIVAARNVARWKAEEIEAAKKATKE